MKKLIALFTAVTFLLAMTTTALAKDRPPAPTEGTPAPENATLTEKRSLMQAAASDGFEIDYCANAITIRSSTCIRLTSITSTFYVCDKITNKYILQRWNGSEWVNYTSTVSISGYEMYEFITTTDKYVPSGYYYRVKTIHQAYRGIDYDSKELISHYVYLE